MWESPTYKAVEGSGGAKLCPEKQWSIPRQGFQFISLTLTEQTEPSGQELLTSILTFAVNLGRKMLN